MSLENFKIQVLLSTNKIIPKEYKKIIKKELLKSYELKGLEKRKDLFYLGMFHRIYDLFTTSVLAIIYRNSISLSCLLRTQIENIALIEYLKENPSDLDIIFQKPKFRDSQKQLNKISKELSKYYGKLTQRSHPFHEGLKMAFLDMEILGPKKSNQIQPENFNNLNTEEFLERFNRIPTISCDAVPYNSIKNEDISIACQNIITLYLSAKSRLNELHSKLPEDKVTDYKEVWKKQNKK